MDLPVAVEVWRGGRVESRHRVSVCVADASGAVRYALGDVATPVYPRSSLKPFQALALVESGAAERFGLGSEELALACASHGGEPMHVERVRRWLGRLGLGPEALACAGHPPLYAAAATDLIRAGQVHGREHDNCSGKHSGMLSVARHRGWPIAGYNLPRHELQRAIARDVADLAGLAQLPEPGMDGCSAAIWPLPLTALATATARLADPASLPPDRRAALIGISQAMRRHPELVAGTGRCCTAVMRALPDVTVKTGAEGVFVAALHGPGLGLALKAEDGAGRAAEVALLACIDALAPFPEAARASLHAFSHPVISDRAGDPVGAIAPVDGWPWFGRA